MEEEKRALLKEILSGAEWEGMLPDGGEEDLLTEFAEEIAKVKNNRYDIRTEFSLNRDLRGPDMARLSGTQPLSGLC